MLNQNKQVLKNIQELFKKAGQSYSIRVGIIGTQAAQIHEDTELTNAELGAVHEFGATINHPGGQPYIIRDGKAVFISKGSQLGQKLIAKGQVTKAHQIVIPTRSFLRMPLLSPEGKRAIISEVSKNYEAFAQYVQAKAKKKGLSEELQAYEQEFKARLQSEAIDLIDFDYLANLIGAAALNRVQKAFEMGGFGKWAAITPQTRKHRKNDPNNPPLQDSGDLMDSITVEVKKK